MAFTVVKSAEPICFIKGIQQIAKLSKMDTFYTWFPFDINVKMQLYNPLKYILKNKKILKNSLKP